MAMASINIPAMTSLASALDAADSELPYDQYGFRSILGGVDVDASPASGIGTVAAWIESQVPGIRRRLALARAIEAGKPGFQTTVQIDESKISTLDPATAQHLGAQAAQDLKDSNGNVDQTLIDGIAQYRNDPYFAAGFAQNITPGELANVVIGASNLRDGLQYVDPSQYQQKYNDWKTKYGAPVSALGGTVATATNNTGDLALPPDYGTQWVKAITDETPNDGGDARYGQGAALSLLLRYGSYGTDFLNTVSTGVYNYERSADESGMWHNRAWVGSTFEGVYDPGDGSSQVSDPLAGIMTGLSHNPVAAQDFFNGGGTETVKIDGHDVQVNSRLKYLIQDRTWASNIGSDNGAGLGGALEAASTYLRNNGDTGRVSAQIAGETFALIGSKTGDGKSDGFLGIGSHQGWKMWDGMRSHVANMIASYAPDLMRIAGRSDSSSDDFADGWTVASDSVFPPGGPWGAAMNRDLMAKVLGTLGEDQKNIDIVLAGVGAAGKLRMSYALQQALNGQPNAPVDMITGDKYVDLVNGASNELAGTFGFVIDNGYQGDKSDQEFQKKRAEELSKALGMVLSMPTFEIPEGHAWTSAIIDQARDVALDKIGEGPDQNAQDTYNETASSAQDKLQHEMLNDLLANGYLDKKYYDQAGSGYVPPPDDALKHNPDGTVTQPPQFDFDSQGYQEWARAGHNLQPWLNTNVIDPFRSQFPALGGG